MQNQCSGRTLFLDMQEPPRDEWGKTQDAVEAALLMEKNWNQPFWAWMAWVLFTQTPTSVTHREPRPKRWETACPTMSAGWLALGWVGRIFL